MQRKDWIIKFISFLNFIEGLAALVFIFWIPSMNKNAAYGGYSLSRMVLGAGVLLLVMLSGWVMIKLNFNRSWQQKVSEKIDNYLSQDNHLLQSISLLGYMFLIGVFAVILFNLPLSTTLGMITAVYERAWSILFWFILFSTQAILGLLIWFPGKINQKGFWQPSVIFKTWLLPILILVSIFHWLVLYLHVYLFQLIPNWYWKYWIKEFSPRDFIFLLMGFVSLVVVFFVIRYPRKWWLNLVLLIFLGYGLQVGFGFMDGGGFEGLRVKFIRGGHSIYAQFASKLPDTWEAITEYDALYGNEIFTDTKPPGVLLFHIVCQKISNTINPVTGYKNIYFRLTSFMAYTFPLLSMLVLVMIYSFSKPYLSDEVRIYPLILYVFLPNVLLMSLEIDQVFFPFLFMAGMLLWQKTLKERSWVWAFASGFYIYLSLYFTFSMLPVLPMLVLWTIIDYFYYQKRNSLKHIILLFVSMGVGVIFGYIMLRLGLKYDFFIRYQNAFAQHHFHKNYDSGLGYVLNAVFLNNVEFAAWSGFAFYILFVVRILRSLSVLFAKVRGKMEGIVISFAGMYGALNLFGQTRSEVGRLWIFLLPLIAIFGADEAMRLFRKKWVGILLLVLLQLVTVFLTFKFQDSINR